MKLVVVHHHHHHNEDTGQILRQLDRVLSALIDLSMRMDTMTKITDAAIKDLGDSVQSLTDTIASITGLVDGVVKAQQDLSDELASEGQDVTKLNALTASIVAARDVLVAKTVANTPVDPGTAIPVAQPTAG